MTQQEADRLFDENKYIFLNEGERVDSGRFESKISSVISRFIEEHRSSRRDLREFTVFYVYNDKRVPTACLDENNNLYISVNYVYSSLRMDEDLVYALLSNVFSHLIVSDIREERELLSKGMPQNTLGSLVRNNYGAPLQLTRPLHHEINIAADVRANRFAMLDERNSRETLKTHMNAVLIGDHYHVPLNTYYHNAELMDNLKKQIGLTFPLTPSFKESQDTFDCGYRQTMRSIIGNLDTSCE